MIRKKKKRKLEFYSSCLMSTTWICLNIVSICFLGSSLCSLLFSRALHVLFGFGNIVEGDASPYLSVNLLACRTSLANVAVYTCITACLKNFRDMTGTWKRSAASPAMKWEEL